MKKPGPYPTAVENNEECGDNFRWNSCVGGLSSKTKATGDGYWCPFCYAKGRYAWIDNTDIKCPDCKTKIVDMDKAKIAKIMKQR